jgi:hypothetical protein
LLVSGLAGAAFSGCGPDQKPPPPCEGPSLILVLTAENGPLPEDTRINVRYGGNRDGEPYALGETRTPQAVFCKELSTPRAEEAPSEGEGGASSSSEQHLGVWTLRCRLFTQGPARLDVEAAGYESIEDESLSFDDDERCEVEKTVVLKRLLDAGT